MNAAPLMATKDHPEALWDRAEECRALANNATDAQLKADYLQIANLYIELAAIEEKVRSREGR